MTISETLLARLKNPSLLMAASYVAGKWAFEAISGSRFQVTDPATGELLADLPDLGPVETSNAIDTAHSVQRQWAAKTGKERAAILRRLFDLIVANTDDLAAIVTAEMGKPLAEARGEILYGASYLEWFAEEGKRINGDVLTSHQDDKRLFVIKQPIGVTGAITPWNFPHAMLARKLAPALAVGCAMVAKPAEQTPLSAIALAVLAERAGLPAGLFSVVTGTDGPAIGREMCSNEKLRKLTFTGSTDVGRILLRQGADQVMKMSMELVGNAPFIVFDDADVDAAVAGVLLSKYRNNGQTCICANRIYVQTAVYDTFAAKLATTVAELELGSGFAPGVTMGPLIDEAAVIKVEEHVADAVSKGAVVLAGGKRSPIGNLFYEPTILTGVTSSMRIAREETFGPVAPLFLFDTVEDVIEQANATEFGLAAYFYSRDLTRVWRVAEALEFGMIGINTGLISTETAPFGGVKQSGQGREGSKYGVEDYLEMKFLCLGIS